MCLEGTYAVWQMSRPTKSLRNVSDQKLIRVPVHFYAGTLKRLDSYILASGGALTRSAAVREFVTNYLLEQENRKAKK